MQRNVYIEGEMGHLFGDTMTVNAPTINDVFRLIDANKKEYLIGKPEKKNPLILELLDTSMHYKLLLLPDLYLGEGYMDGKIKIHNGTITEFLEITLKNLGLNLLNWLLDFPRFENSY